MNVSAYAKGFVRWPGTRHAPTHWGQVYASRGAASRHGNEKKH